MLLYIAAFAKQKLATVKIIIFQMSPLNRKQHTCADKQQNITPFDTVTATQSNYDWHLVWPVSNYSWSYYDWSVCLPALKAHCDIPVCIAFC